MKAATLQKIEDEIEAGDYGKARDRLHGLLVTYPDDLSIRRRLGDVCWQLQHPAMAGRYWYLEADQTPEMISACQAFERSCGYAPSQMLLALKFRGDIEPIRDTFAGRSLLALQEQAKERGRIFEFGKSGAAKFGGPYEETDSKWVNIGCIAALILAAALMIIGLATILHWIF